MVNRLLDKVAVITGAAGGIGLESAALFLKEGAKVVIADINEKALEVAEGRLKKLVLNAPVVICVCDVSKEDQVKNLVETAVKQFGRLDIIFNNAGIMHGQDDDAVNTEEKIWDLTHNINVKGVWYGCKYAILQFRAQKSPGAIINTASVVAVMGSAAPQLAYTASKGAVLAMSRELAIVHAKEGIRINALCPGPLNTPLLQDFLDTDAKRIRRTIHLPMGRFGEAVEQAHAAVFLASDEASYITGRDFLVDGGLSSAYVTAEGESPIPAPKSALADV